MSAFTSDVTNVQIPTEEEAEAILAEATISEIGTVEHVDLINVMQAITLGKLTVSQVVGAGIAAVKAEGGYKVGQSYDYFDHKQINYGLKLQKICMSIKASDVVTDRLVSELLDGNSDYYKGRMSLTIKSDLIEEEFEKNGQTYKTGRSYYEIETTAYYVSSGVQTTWTVEQANGIRVLKSLYVKDADKGLFYFLGANGTELPVRLGHQSAYDWMLNKLNTSGNIKKYLETLQTVPAALARRLFTESKYGSEKDNRKAQNELFLSAYKGVKVDLQALVESKPKAAAVEPTN